MHLSLAIHLYVLFVFFFFVLSFYLFFFFFFNDPATTEIYTLSLHDALPICLRPRRSGDAGSSGSRARPSPCGRFPPDRKSTRLNSSHGYISYAVFCLKKKKKKNNTIIIKQPIILNDHIYINILFTRLYLNLS